MITFDSAHEIADTVDALTEDFCTFARGPGGSVICSIMVPVKAFGLPIRNRIEHVLTAPEVTALKALIGPWLTSGAQKFATDNTKPAGLAAPK